MDRSPVHFWQMYDVIRRDYFHTFPMKMICSLQINNLSELRFVFLRSKPLSMSMGYLSTEDDCVALWQCWDDCKALCNEEVEICCRSVTYPLHWTLVMIVNLFAMKELSFFVLRSKPLSMSIGYLLWSFWQWKVRLCRCQLVTYRQIMIVDLFVNVDWLPINRWWLWSSLQWRS